jgi:endonuclease III-like uncharacterized protein
VIGSRERRGKQLLDDLKDTRGYWKLKDEALDRTLWRTSFGRCCGAVVIQTTDWLNVQIHIKTLSFLLFFYLTAYFVCLGESIIFQEFCYE